MSKTKPNSHSMRLTAADHQLILYHFTSKRAAKKIALQGLKLNWVTDMPHDVIRPMRAVWLSDSPTMSPIYSKSAEVRLSVSIARNDVKLVHWRSMLKGRLCRSSLANLDLEVPEWRSFYLYFAAIKVSHIGEVKPYSSVSTVKACREAHFERLALLGIE